LEPSPVEGAAAPADGRQSERALEIARGVCRHFRNLGFATVTELTFADGRRADVVALSAKGSLWIVEVKSSLEDFRSDAKWPDYRQWCDRLYFAVLPDFPREVLPDDAGIIVADRYGAEILREAPETPLAGARRKAVTLRFAQVAALRLQMLWDPDSAMGT
jgi:hypothetical protein